MQLSESSISAFLKAKPCRVEPSSDCVHAVCYWSLIRARNLFSKNVRLITGSKNFLRNYFAKLNNSKFGHLVQTLLWKQNCRSGQLDHYAVRGICHLIKKRRVFQASAFERHLPLRSSQISWHCEMTSDACRSRGEAGHPDLGCILRFAMIWGFSILPDLKGTVAHPHWKCIPTQESCSHVDAMMEAVSCSIRFYTLTHSSIPEFLG